MKGTGTPNARGSKGDQILFVSLVTMSLLGVSAQAHAQCAGFSVAADSCPLGITIQGCCDGASIAQWCDDGTLCSWDCAQEGPESVCGWEPVGMTGHYVCRDGFAEDPSGENPPSCDDAMGCPCVEIECGFDYSPANVDSPGCFCGLCEGGLSCDTDMGKCICVPSCAGKQCGADGCGDFCGTCAEGSLCTSQGLCVSDGCEPDCWAKECGGDGCGDVCGQCSAASSCQNGVCVTGCAGDCVGRDCGDDGCGGTCGQCLQSATCNAKGNCVLTCEPSCGDKNCGGDGCGGACGGCPEGATCTPEGLCGVGGACSCVGRVCGDDGCGNSCGDCFGNTGCNSQTGLCEEGSAGTRDLCPPGTRWNSWAETCAITEGSMMQPDEAPADGCGGGASQGLLWIAVGLWLVPGLRSRRRPLSPSPLG